MFPNLARQRFTAKMSGSSYDFGFLPYAKAMATDAEYLTVRIDVRDRIGTNKILVRTFLHGPDVCQVHR